jgi:uncharacterized membrane protein YcaP (DUF421 family)
VPDSLKLKTRVMYFIHQLFGEGKDLNSLQMTARGIVVFFFALILIRISGRRSFGIRTPLDNIIVILLGTILGRAIVGASGFLPVIVVSLSIVLIHRFIAFLIFKYPTLSNLVEGKKILLFENGIFIEENLKKALVCKEDVIQGVRKSALTENLNEIDKIYIERNGEITAIKRL